MNAAGKRSGDRREVELCAWVEEEGRIVFPHCLRVSRKVECYYVSVCVWLKPDKQDKFSGGESRFYHPPTLPSDNNYKQIKHQSDPTLGWPRIEWLWRAGDTKRDDKVSSYVKLCQAMSSGVGKTVFLFLFLSLSEWHSNALSLACVASTVAHPDDNSLVEDITWKKKKSIELPIEWNLNLNWFARRIVWPRLANLILNPDAETVCRWHQFSYL